MSDQRTYIPQEVKPPQPKPVSPTAWVFHPFIAATFVPISLYLRNFGGVYWWELAWAVGVSMAVAGIAMLVLNQIFRNWRRSGMAATVTVVFIYGFGYSYQINELCSVVGSNMFFSTGTLQAIWAVLWIGVLLWLNKPRNDDEQLTRTANLFATVALAGPLMFAGWDFLVDGSAVMTEATDIAEEAIVLHPSQSPPDVYYLVFDRYGSGETLANEFNHNNEPFLKNLESRGFQVSRESRANYPKTELSMSSALNMRYHGDGVEARWKYTELLHNHRVGELLKGENYRYYHLGSVLDGVRTNPNAHYSYRSSVMPTEFTDMLWQFSYFYPLAPNTGAAQIERDKFNLVQSIAKEGGRKFVYAHFLLPHEPWKFDRDGSPLSENVAYARTEKENYINQLIYANTRIEETVDAILAQSKQPPIIIVQADEGPELRYVGDELKSEIDQIRMRSGIITAIHLPRGEETPADLSPVNTFRFVFQKYFGADIELLPNRHFYWDRVTDYGKPQFGEQVRFVDVTHRLKHIENIAASE